MGEWLITAILGVSAWLFWTVLGELIALVSWTATGPVRRPIWNAFVRAKGPWPLLLLLGAGTAVGATGVWAMERQEPGWAGPPGFALFLGGAGIVLFAPLLWRDARRERELQAQGGIVSESGELP